MWKTMFDRLPTAIFSQKSKQVRYEIKCTGLENQETPSFLAFRCLAHNGNRRVCAVKILRNNDVITRIYAGA